MIGLKTKAKKLIEKKINIKTSFFIIFQQLNIL